MIRAFNTSATGMAAQQTVLDNAANNLANLNTTGFKRSTVEFQDLLYATLRQPGSLSGQGLQVPTGTQIGNGVRVAGTTRTFTTGTPQQTGNSLNMAIQGDGFFQIVNPAGGNLYTRDGTFSLNSSYQLVTADGYTVNPAMTFPADTMTISVGTDGTISATTAGSPTTSTQVGRLTLVRFPNPAGLSAQGRNFFTETPASGTPQAGITPGLQGSGTLIGGSLEQSNVDVVQEMVNLIQAQRAYEFNTKAVQAADQMLAASNNLIR
jgi:flagellar basal-body rod protein FlgG